MANCGEDKVVELRQARDAIQDESIHSHAAGVIAIAENVFSWTGENAYAALDAMCTSGKDIVLDSFFILCINNM